MAMAEVESPLIDDNGEVLRLKNGMISSLAEFQPQLLDLLYDIQNEKLSDDLQKMEETTGINREQVAYGFIGMVAIYLIIGEEAGLLCNFIGFLYPAIASVVAMEMDSRYDVFLWLLYWMCFGMLSIADFYAKRIMNIVPLYWLFKTCILLYLMVPRTNAIHNLYVAIVIPAVAAIEDFIMNYDVKVNKRRRNTTVDEADV
ncbi:Receptor expression-enhancing protein 5 [Toxocara canis]|uniref:Receptor expression-enhancing protein n=2 Tax=Toxocara canis TaxID=6265 RepID=A0A0B2W4I9_TOXCA|nr:Receptor expression-enhancing protein 5 [Toxocara canis]